MTEHDLDSASDSGVSGDWEQLGKARNGGGQQHHGDGEQLEDGQGGSKKGGKKDLSHVACRFYRVGACTAGASCPFSHSAREPGQTKPPCKWFQKGSCKFGHKCANAHIMPGDPPSMDWKNKKASKVAHQTEAGAGSSEANVLSPTPTSPGSFAPSSPNTNGGALSGQQKQPVSSGLSSMFGRNGTNGSTPTPTSNGRLSAVAAEGAGAAIGMSPIGLPLPADLPIPAGNASAKAPGAEPSSATKPKTFSYASIVGASNAANTNTAQSPSASKSALPQVGSLTNPGALRSPPVSAKSVSSTSPSVSTLSHGINPASPSFVPRAMQSPSANNGASSSSLSTSIPSAFHMDQLERNMPSVPSYGALPQAPQQGFSSGSYQRFNHQPSPLAPPPLQHSHSHSNSIPGRSFLGQAGPGSLSPSMVPMGSGGQHVRPPIPSPATAAFGTSPFGNNAIFLSTSHEEDAGSFMARANRAPGVGRGISPARPGFEARSFSARSKHGSSALADDDEDGTQDDNVLEEELVPSSLKHLLTPDEKARRDSRSGAKSGFFNPFDDAGDEDDDDFDQEVAAELRLRYSQSVPAPAASALSQFNRAPGSPPTFVGHSPFASGLVRPIGDSISGSNSASSSSNLAKHLLTGGPAQGHRVERGFTMADQGGSDATGNSRSGGSQLSTLGSSLPQGMAAGLSRLHMIPAGSEHTGYTPPTSFVQSPSARSHLAAGTQHTSSSPTLQSSNSYLAPGNLGRPAPGSSYGIKLPSLLHQQHPGVGSRKISSNHYEAAQVHVGSPLARTEIHGHIGSGRESVQRHHPEAHGQHGSEGDEDDLVFDMDV